MSLLAVKQRMPFPLFIVVLVIVVMLAGFACACLTDHPEQALDRGFLAVNEPSRPLAEAALIAIGGLLMTSFLASQAPTRARLQSYRL